MFLAGRHLDKIQENRTTMISGSYQVQVHIIECRDLKSDHLSGLASPYIHIKVMGRSKKTRVIRKVKMGWIKHAQHSASSSVCIGLKLRL